MNAGANTATTATTGRRVVRLRRRWSRPGAAAGAAESTFGEQAWGQSRGAAGRWAAGGALLGTLLGLLAFAPAAWLARSVASATSERLLLTDTRGTVWSGSAVAVLTGGPDSRDASSLPGRIDWTIGPSLDGFALRARHACCLNGTVALQLRPGFGRLSAALLPSAGWTGQWPSAFLSGLGTPFNTMQLGGLIRLTSPGGIRFQTVQGRWQIDGSADIELLRVASRLTTLDMLGSYRLSLTDDPANDSVSLLRLSTLDGVLQLTGDGSWGPGGMRFRGEARARSPADAPALTNLLNIIGQRQGARSVISIGSA